MRWDTHVGSVPMKYATRKQVQGPSNASHTSVNECKIEFPKWCLLQDKEELAGPKREEWMTELPPEVKAFGKYNYTEDGKMVAVCCDCRAWAQKVSKQRC